MIDDITFINVTNNAVSMRAASKELKIPFTTFKRKAEKLGIYKPNQGGKGLNKSKEFKFPLWDILEGNHPSFQTNKLRKRLIREEVFEHKCNKCGLTKWNNKPIPLELEHINGINNDHRIENLELLCPNCHAQTSTYRGKNKKRN